MLVREGFIWWSDGDLVFWFVYLLNFEDFREFKGLSYHTVTLIIY